MDTIAVRAFAVLLAATAACAQAAAADQPVTVIRPTQARITRYLEMTGTVAAMQSVDLVARVSGVLESIDVADGAVVHKGTTLFVIEPLPYESKLRQAQAFEEQQRATVVQADAEHKRQAELGKTNDSSQSTVDSARATRDSARAALAQAEEATKQAAITYTYTRVTAPFDGVMTTHLASVGELVGYNSPTTLATILQLDPIWVNANISQADVMRARAVLAAKGKTVRDLGPVKLEAALAGETGFPHHGTLDYVAPTVDGSTGTLAIRGKFENPGYTLLPGYFVKLRVPLEPDAQVLLLPFDAITSDQGTPVVYVVAPDGTVKQQAVRTGGSHDGMQIIDSGLAPEDRVIASAAGSVIDPGARVQAVEAAARTPARP
jgi:RND family efflux transporter MFP subunit